VSAPVRLAVIGATGRVGSALVRLAPERGFVVTRAFGRVGADPYVGVPVETDVASLSSGGFDVAIDFSSADAFSSIASHVAASGAPLVSGTTGLTSKDVSSIDEIARRIPILWEPNLSVGAHVLGRLLRQAIAALGDGFDVEIVETHHRKKVDAPSGTALRLAAIAQEAGTGRELRHGREGKPGPRSAREVGLHAVRGGDVIGDHSVHLLGQGERLELVHRATDRDVFALGALRAAAWLVGKPNGRYALADVIEGS